MGRFGEDLVADILSCMPTKSVVRFKCLNKYYNQITYDPIFAANHALQSKPEVHGLFQISVLDSENTLFFTFHNSKPKVYQSQLPPIIASCNGFLLLNLPGSNLCMLNPTTDKFKIIPKSKAAYRCSKWNFGLAYDPIAYSSFNYKLVHIYRNHILIPGVEVYSFEIFDLGADSWRESKSKLICGMAKFVKVNGQGVYLDGFVHWLRLCGDIIRFDVETEEATIMTLPEDLIDEWSGHENHSWFGAADGLIYLVYVSGRETVMWVLHNYENNRWGRVRTKILGLPLGSCPIFFDGARIVLQCGEQNEREIYMYNMKTEEWNHIGNIPSEMDGTHNAYIPFIPTLAPVNNGTPSNGNSLECEFENFQTMIKKYQYKKRKQEAMTSHYQLRSRTMEESQRLAT